MDAWGRHGDVRLDVQFEGVGVVPGRCSQPGEKFTYRKAIKSDLKHVDVAEGTSETRVRRVGRRNQSQALKAET